MLIIGADDAANRITQEYCNYLTNNWGFCLKSNGIV